MKELRIGKTFYKAQPRDAIHIAVASVIAGTDDLKPGQRVEFTANDRKAVGPCKEDGHGIGVVDPFIRYQIRKGEHFYVFLYPGTITGLRHEWLHPSFDDMPKQESVRWIEQFAAEIDQTYNSLMRAAHKWIDEDGGWDAFTYDNSESYKDAAPEKWPLFWKHFEIVTGQKVKDHDAHFFTCSC